MAVHGFPSLQAVPIGSTLQVAEQQSPPVALPSSQLSVGSRVPLPQFAPTSYTFTVQLAVSTLAPFFSGLTRFVSATIRLVNV